VIEAVVFDMDGVLCRYRIERRLELLARFTGQRPEAVYAAIWQSGFEDAGERGAWSADEYLRLFGERLGTSLDLDLWIAARKAAMEPDEAVLEIARKLRAKLPVGVFTNNPPLLKRHIAEVFPAVLEVFGDRAVFSSDLGAVKPDQEAFHRLAHRLSVRPETLLFFDDDATYVAGARAAGLTAYQFEGAEKLVTRLTEVGFDVA